MVVRFAGAFYEAAAKQQELQGQIQIGLLQGIVARAELQLQESVKQTRESVKQTQSLERLADRLAPDLGAHKRNYLERIAHQCGYLPLRGVDFRTSDATVGGDERMALADVYIDLNTQTRAPLTEEDQDKHQDKRSRRGGADDDAEDRPLPALEALISHPRMVLLGGPGSGKSTFVNHVAVCLAGYHLHPEADWLERLPDWPPAWSDLLPIPVTLRELAAWSAGNAEAQSKSGLLLAYLKHWLAQWGLVEFHPALCDALRHGKALLLLDGLDEAPVRDEELLRRVKAMIVDLSPAFPDAPILITCRVLSYQDERWQLETGEWPSFELAPLDEARIDRFIHAWYRQLAAMQVACLQSLSAGQAGKARQVKNAGALSAKLQQAVRRPDLWRLADNPLLLTVMALMHTHKGELPDARALLYEDVVDLLLWRWDAIKVESADGRETTWRQLLQDADLKDIDLKQILWKLAHDAHGHVQESASPEDTADIPESTLHRELRALHPARSLDWADQMVQITKLRAGLLVEDLPGVYRFPHCTFQEYLAGCHLSNLSDFTGTAVGLAGQGAFWREVILLAVGRLGALERRRRQTSDAGQ